MFTLSTSGALVQGKEESRVSKRAARGAPAVRRSRRPGGYHHGNLRTALLDAALRLVKTGGPETLTLRAAARLAGVSQAAPYRHFANKEALLAAVAEEGFRAMTAAMRKATDAASGPLERFRALGLSYIQFATSNPSHFRVMFGSETGDRSAYAGLHEAATENFHMLIDAVAECQQAGLVRSGEAEELALAAWSNVHGVSALLVNRQLTRLANRPPAELADVVTRDLFLGLRAT